MPAFDVLGTDRLDVPGADVEPAHGSWAHGGGSCSAARSLALLSIRRAGRRCESSSVEVLEQAGLPQVLAAQLAEALLEHFGTALPLVHGPQVHEKLDSRVVLAWALRVDQHAHPLPDMFLFASQRFQALLANNRSLALTAGAFLLPACHREPLPLGATGLRGLEQLAHRTAWRSCRADRRLPAEASQQLHPQVRVIAMENLHQRTNSAFFSATGRFSTHRARSTADLSSDIDRSLAKAATASKSSSMRRRSARLRSGAVSAARSGGTGGSATSSSSAPP